METIRSRRKFENIIFVDKIARRVARIQLIGIQRGSVCLDFLNGRLRIISSYQTLFSQLLSIIGFFILSKLRLFGNHRLRRNMKFLENSKLEWLSSKLSVETNEYRLETRIESYSCKMAGQDKRLFKGLLQAEGSTAKDLQALSPPSVESGWVFPKSCSPSNSSDQEMEGDVVPILCDTVNRVTLYNLIATLNTSFPDYDFMDAKGENFSKLPSLDFVTPCVDGKLATVGESYNKIKHQMWAILDEEIHLKECVIFSYHPDYHSDPYSEDGCTWSFNYFFFNKKLKRILFFSCRALSVRALRSSCDDEDELEWSMDA